MTDLLGQTDVEFLRNKDYDYEVSLDSGFISVILKDFRLPVGYRPASTSLLLRLPLQFPDVAPDMFWMEPHVGYRDGGVPPATEVREDYLGRTWQRWSRHFGRSLWRPGVDSLQSYVRLIQATLEREIGALAA